MKCFIIDDEAYSIDTLKRYLEVSKQLELIGTATNPIDGLNMIRQNPDIDLVFLDVDMPALSGIEAAALLPGHISIIFCTAHAKYAVKAFDLQAQDFLLKPVSFTRFLQAVNKIQTIRQNSVQQHLPDAADDTLFINPGVKGKFIQLHADNIIYIEGLKNYVLLHTDDRNKHITYLTMNEIQQSLADRHFLRVHKSYIVNRSKIVSVDGNTIKLDNDIEIPIGITYKEDFFHEITKFTLQSKRKLS